jgi:hypothetical protein
MDECRPPPRPTGATIHDSPLHYDDDGNVAQRAYKIFPKHDPKELSPPTQLLTGHSSKEAEQPDQESAKMISIVQRANLRLLLTPCSPEYGGTTTLEAEPSMTESLIPKNWNQRTTWRWRRRQRWLASDYVAQRPRAISLASRSKSPR